MKSEQLTRVSRFCFVGAEVVAGGVCVGAGAGVCVAYGCCWVLAAARGCVAARMLSGVD